VPAAHHDNRLPQAVHANVPRAASQRSPAGRLAPRPEHTNRLFPFINTSCALSIAYPTVQSLSLILFAFHILGAERLLRHLHANKVPFCLATSSGADMVELKSNQHRELFSLFNHKVCGSTDKEVANGKPAPDIFLVAASRFAVPPKASDCLVFEDSPNGVTAGNSAGMQVVMVPDPRLSQEKTSHATQVLGSLADFKPELFGLPPFKD